MTSSDKVRNRYMLHLGPSHELLKSDLTKSTDVAAQKFKHFMAFLERQINCRIHVLRSDGGKE